MTPLEQPDPRPWHAALPEPQSKGQQLSSDEVKARLEKQAGDSQDFLLVDVRRTDWEGGTISTSINFPAHSFYQTRPIIHQLCKQAGIKQVVTYCGSSQGRGPRCAAWLQDYFNDVGEQDIKVAVLQGGIKGWVKAYGGEMMDWYDESVWVAPHACPDRR